ncbi:hypothetical protein SEMRO_632_G178620.1 [Seminavis robusta]|uniref:Uncharacterized protein n=1 Tax=Seminavis robusta TaxID=568900 RepID=A0A9N8E972_9STRA|nr:hypothetical protein SEMRO_632_G178620.1 [Seminavis robusta]|eukprot:Sro632_g178620.1 n/a (316) ;mRNA; r:775-1832
MANNANDGAFGLEDVPDLPEAPTEQPKYNRDYHRLFVKFMSWLHKRTYTKAARFQPSALRGIQPHHVADYLKWRAATWNGTSGNPTKSDPVNEVVKEVKKAETQHRGKKSCATRDLTETEYRKVVHELYGKGSFESTIRTACMLKQQVHLITRTRRHLQVEVFRLQAASRLPFCAQLQGELVQEYFGTTMPDQIILGSMDTDFCAMLGLANYMEASSTTGMAPWSGRCILFTPESIPSWLPSTQRSLPQHSQGCLFVGSISVLWRSSLPVFLGVTAFGSLLQLWQEGWCYLLTKLTFEVAGRLAYLDGLLMPTFA